MEGTRRKGKPILRWEDCVKETVGGGGNETGLVTKKKGEQKRRQCVYEVKSA